MLCWLGSSSLGSFDGGRSNLTRLRTLLDAIITSSDRQ